MKQRLYFLIGGWIFWTTIHFLTLISFGTETPIAFVDSSLSNLILVIACMGVGYSIRYYRPASPISYVYIMVGAVALTILYTWVDLSLLLEVFRDQLQYVEFIKDSVMIRSAVAFLLICLSVLTGLQIDYNAANEEEKNRVNEIQRLARDAQLTNLLQKIQPHFLFNTLNSVNALVQTDPRSAGKMIRQLADYLRGILRSEGTGMVSLEEEISQMKLYLEIEKVRFGDRLIIDINVDSDANSMMIPPLLLQPLVENAIKFGLYDTLGAVPVTIHAVRINTGLILSVSNPYDAETSGKSEGTGFGLKALRKRLQLLYGRSDLMEISSSGRNFTVTLRVPGT